MSSLHDLALVPPIMTQLKLNYQCGSVVIVRTHRDVDFQGQVFQNPSDTGVKSSITLLNVVIVASGEKLSGHLTWDQHEIKAITLVQDAPKLIRIIKETVMDTVIISDQTMLSRLIEIVLKVKEIGCFIPDCAKGRLSKPKYVVLNIKNLLVVIPLENLISSKESLTLRNSFRDVLDQNLFSNPHIIKVCVDSRCVTDYLFHNHRIRLKNVYDLKAIENYLRNQHNNNNDLLGSSKVSTESPTCQQPTIRLIDLLKKYLPQSVPKCDLKFLSVNENNLNFSTDKKYCALEVKYLLQLKEEMKKCLMRPLNERVMQKQSRIIQGGMMSF